MGKPNVQAIVQAVGGYLKEHPEEILRVVRGAVALRLGVPIDALRYLARELGGGKKAPKDVVIDTAPPGIRLQMSVDAMGTALRVALVVAVEELVVDPTQIRIVVRISELDLKVLDDSETPVAGLIKSGALDLSKPGNLVAYMPKRPAALVDAKDDRITLDLMKVPALAQNKKLRRALAILTPVVGIRALRAKNEHVDLQLSASLGGLSEAIAAART